LIFNARLAAGYLSFGVATLCLILQPWVTLGDLGWNWVNIGGRGGGGRKLPELPCAPRSPILKNKELPQIRADDR
jgi:hypothetical protein